MLEQTLRYFLAVAETGSLSEAALVLDVSQSGVSRQLKQLESYLGRALFIRTGRGVALNDAGYRLEAAIRPAFKDIDQMLDTLRSEIGIVQGSVRIATVHTLSHYFLPQLLQEFHATHPGINAYLLGRSSPDVVKLVESGKADVGFVYDTAVDSDRLTINRLFEERMCLAYHKDEPCASPIADDQEWALPLITFPKYYALRRMIHRAQLDRNVVAEVDTVDSMLRLVSYRLGVCILPDLIPELEFAKLQLARRPIALPELRRWVVCISDPNTALTSTCRALIALAVDSAFRWYHSAQGGQAKTIAS